MTTPAIDFGFITCAQLKELTADEQFLFNLLKSKGYKCQALVWDDTDIDWQTVKVAIIRSAWDYHLKTVEFLKWIDSVSSKTILKNNPDLIHWNIDKRYLEDLSKSGWPVIPTTYLKRGSQVNILSLLKEQNWSDIIIKPSVGLSAYGVKRINTSRTSLGEGQLHIENLLKTGEVMVQPYYSSIEDYGERNLIFIDGDYSHCVKKIRFPTTDKAEDTVVAADEAELLLAQKLVKKIQPHAFFARVDLVRNPDNQPCLIELEVIDPNLFFGLHPPALEKCAARLIQLLKRSYPAVPVG